jgi:hypothetical protein
MKTWQKPRLIVLVRTTAGESVLSTCKGETVGTSSQSTDMGCYQQTSATVISCLFCQLTVES